MQQIMIHTDGGARGNPGPAGIGVAFFDATGVQVAELSEYIGIATNNVAEYTAIVRALEVLPTLIDVTKVNVTFKLDSQLVERQMNGVYKVKDATLKTYFDKANVLIKQLREVTFVYIPREQNKVADKLANQAMDKGA